MEKVAQYRQLAIECHEKAASAHDSRTRMTYEDMAQLWESLAEERLKMLEDRLRREKPN